MHSCVCVGMGIGVISFALADVLMGLAAWDQTVSVTHNSEQTGLRVRRFVRCPGKCRRHAWHVNAQRFGSGP